MGSQVTLDFTRAPELVDSGKKLEKLTFTGSGDLKKFIYDFAAIQKTSVSELIQRYVILGLKEDLGTMLLTQANQEKTLGQLLRR